MGIKTRSFDIKAPQRYVSFERTFTGSGASVTSLVGFVWPFSRKGVLVDLVCTLEVAGSITSITILPKKNNNQLTLATSGVIAVAAGVGATIDAKAEASLPSGATRPVLHPTTSNRVFSKGDRFTVDLTQSGTTTTPAQVKIVAIFEGEE